jgi:hydroxymethylpyrimidine pyrophosphatase-like HAD family hydrolase
MQLPKIQLTAAVFDVDGTIADRETEVIPDYLGEYLAEFSKEVPVAICTGRRLELLLDKMGPILKFCGNEDEGRGRWLMLCENGAIGYFFDVENKEYKEFYRVPYPYNEAHRNELFERIKKATEHICGHAYMNRVTMVFSPKSRGNSENHIVTKHSSELAAIALPIIKEMDPKGEIAIGDSGIAINIIPREGDKDKGVFAFGEYLKKKGLNLSPAFNEIVCIGDQPEPGCNDEKFLNGKFGTPFTVGETHPFNELPIAVTDENGNKIFGPRGTLYLLKHLLWNQSNRQIV